ncbi:MAG: lamin tail domain-containing protein, partial [Kiritimatiellae bacterium]|nr:lamin tail domain-containing protein [Kiritimatiellia bacterium]
VPQSLSEYRLSGDVDFTFPAGLSIPPRGHIIVAADPDAIQDLHQTSGILGPYEGSLSNGGGTLRLRNRQDAILLEVEYDDDPPWPVAADGAGHSLVQYSPDFGENDVRAWGISAERGGSMRAHDMPVNTPRSSIRINEVLAHTDLPDVDYIEIFNSSTTPVDMLGFALTENIETNKYLFPSNSIIAAHGYLLLTQTNLGFSLSSHGDHVFLTDLIENRVVDAVRFGATQNGIAQGRTPDGAPDGLQTLSANSPGTTNAQARVNSVVINEIMYHPITEDGNDEYVELYNHGTTTVDVSHWQFTDGINYVIPAGTHIAADGFLVIAENAAHMIARYASLNGTNTVGNFSGSLSDSGECIVLSRPDNLSFPTTDLVHVDEVTYGDGPRWGAWTDGGGSSLELCDASSDNRLAPNWAGSDETQKAPWVLVEHTGKLDNGNSARLPEELHLLLLGQGECLVDDIEIIKAGNPLVFNGDFEGGLTGWLIQGNHQDSVLETTEGFSSSQSLHLIAESDGDTASNRAEIDVAGLTTADDNITIRARVRWLAGHRDILLRLLGNWLETSGTLPVPANLGSPGEPNSCVTTNSGPAITDTQHSPLMPAANIDVTITTRVHDHDGVASVTLRFRVDLAAPFRASS